MYKAYLEQKITVEVNYVGVENGNHVWSTRILEVESAPKYFYRSTKEKKPTLFQVADNIARWHKAYVE